MLNPDKKYIHSDGSDLPIMYCYLAGRITGNCMDKCIEWRHQIIDHYKDYNGKGLYPISFLDALNSKEADSIDGLGLTSGIPPNLIFDKDILSVQTAHVIVANMDDFMGAGIEDLLDFNEWVFEDSRKITEQDQKEYDEMKNFDYKDAFFKLQDKINNRRPNLGTIEEVAIARQMGKPIILIVPPNQLHIYQNHPFQKRASVIVSSVDELLEKKWLNILYKSISGALY